MQVVAPKLDHGMVGKFEVSEGIDNLLKPTTRQSRDKKSFHLGETEIIDLLSRKEK